MLVGWRPAACGRRKETGRAGGAGRAALATFPFVTPAVRPIQANYGPHMMDGGFFDNYGMATLTEWLDQALEEQAARSRPGNEQVKRVLILQVDGFPPSSFEPPKPPAGRGGWLLQLIDPIEILVNVRTAGQVSHRDVEMELLRAKWRARGIAIDDVHFELNNSDAPLSWHLMPTQKAAIADSWTANPYVVRARQKVANFLKGLPATAGNFDSPAEAADTQTVG